MNEARFLTFVIALGILISGNFASAQGDGITVVNPLSCQEIGCVIERIANFLFTIGVPILTIMVLWGAYLLLTSSGNPDRVDDGRKALMWALIGFVVLAINWGFASILREILSGGNVGGGAGSGGRGPMQLTPY